MPRSFEICVNNGGRVRTIAGPYKKHDLKAGQYRRVCFIQGEMHYGEIKTKEGASK